LLVVSFPLTAWNGVRPQSDKEAAGAPQTIALYGYAACHRAVSELNADSMLPEDPKLLSWR